MVGGLELAFEGFAHLIDNSVDAGATRVTIRSTQPKQKFLHIQDNGDGMTRSELRACMSLGISRKNKNFRQYGYGFNIGTSRLGADALVITSSRVSPNICTVGFLSFTYLKEENKNYTIIPMLDFVDGVLQLEGPINKEYSRIIYAYSTYNDMHNLKLQVDSLGGHSGTIIVISNLWFVNGQRELVFYSHKKDIRINSLTMNNGNLCSNCELLSSYKYSFRSYGSILYRKTLLQIILFGEVITYKDIESDLEQLQALHFKIGPSNSETQCIFTVGFLKCGHTSQFEGIILYWRNRLIKVLWKYYRNKRTKDGTIKHPITAGITGILESDCLEPDKYKQHIRDTLITEALKREMRKLLVNFSKTNPQESHVENINENENGDSLVNPQKSHQDNEANTTNPQENDDENNSLNEDNLIIPQEGHHVNEASTTNLQGSHVENVNENEVHFVNPQESHYVNEASETNPQDSRDENNRVQGDNHGGQKSSHQYITQFSEPLRQYIKDITDVEGDGHCGFRAIASCINSRENEWASVRLALIEFLVGVDLSEEQRQTLQEELDCFDGTVPEKNWFDMSTMARLVALQYKVVLIVICRDENKYMSFTYVPYNLVPTKQPTEYVIGFVNGNHFVKLQMSPDHPIPPISLDRPTIIGCNDDYWDEWNQALKHRTEKYLEIMGLKVKELQMSHDHPIPPISLDRLTINGCGDDYWDDWNQPLEQQTEINLQNTGLKQKEIPNNDQSNNKRTKKVPAEDQMENENDKSSEGKRRRARKPNKPGSNAATESDNNEKGKEGEKRYARKTDKRVSKEAADSNRKKQRDGKEKDLLKEIQQLIRDWDQFNKQLDQLSQKRDELVKQGKQVSHKQKELEKQGRIRKVKRKLKLKSNIQRRLEEIKAKLENITRLQ